MTKTLVIHTGNPGTLFDNMYPLGTCFWCRLGEGEVKVVYFATNRQVFFEGKLSDEELANLVGQAQEVHTIEVDDFTQEIRIEE